MFAALVIVLQNLKSCNLWVIIKLYVLRLLNTGPVGYWTRSFLVLVVILKLDLSCTRVAFLYSMIIATLCIYKIFFAF